MPTSSQAGARVQPAAAPKARSAESSEPQQKGPKRYMMRRELSQAVPTMDEQIARREMFMGQSNKTCWDQARGCFGGEETKLVTYSSSGHVKKYDIGRLHRLGFAAILRGTVIEDPFLIAQTVGLVCFAIVLALLLGDDVTVLGQQAEFINFILAPLHSLSAFLLALFVAMVLNRWFTIRHDAAGGIMGRTSDICFIVGQLMPGTDVGTLALRRRVLRYMLLCFMLVFSEARGEFRSDEGVQASLEALIDAGLLSRDEEPHLREMPRGKGSQVVISWIGRTIFTAQALRQGADPFERKLLFEALMGLKAKVAQAHAMVGAQIPLPYTALITMLVKLTLVAYTASTGLELRFAVETQDFQNGVAALFVLALYAVFFQGCLNLHTVLSNPFGYDAADFPQSDFFKDTAFACHVALEGPTDMSSYAKAFAKSCAKDEKSATGPRRVGAEAQAAAKERREVALQELRMMRVGMDGDQKKPAPQKGSGGMRWSLNGLVPQAPSEQDADCEDDMPRSTSWRPFANLRRGTSADPESEGADVSVREFSGDDADLPGGATDGADARPRTARSEDGAAAQKKDTKAGTGLSSTMPAKVGAAPTAANKKATSTGLVEREKTGPAPAPAKKSTTTSTLVGSTSGGATASTDGSRPASSPAPNKGSAPGRK